MNEELYKELTSKNMVLYSKNHNPSELKFHLHDTYEVYFFIAGDVTYFVENSSYPMSYGDLVITNTTEIHTPIFHSQACYERIIFHFSPAFLRHIRLPSFNPEKCFVDRPDGSFNKVSLDGHQIDEFMQIYRNVELANKDLKGSNILKKYSSLIELTVMLNSAFSGSELYRNPSSMSRRISDIMKYIDENIDRKITLKLLSEKFFINDTYLCALFKRHVGKTVHQYIVFKRIAYAKKLLSSGYNVTETSQLCGFNDYSNFIKTFKKVTGKSPGRYKHT